jgi:Zinc-finger double-stranded RNA-binding
VAKQAAIKTEVTAVLKPFYCDLCDKQYQTVAQYDEHCNSVRIWAISSEWILRLLQYAHHHKIREKDLRAAARVGKDSTSVRQEKERKREEKELRKMAKLHGIKLATPSQTAPLAATATATVTAGGWGSTGFSSLAPAAPIATVTTSNASKGFKSGVWASVGSASSLPPAANPPAKSGRWNAAGSAGTSSPSLPADPSPPNEPAPTPPPPPPSTNKTPAFRSSGWTQMDHLTDVKTIVDTESPSVNTHPYPSMDYEMDHPPPPPPAGLAPPPPSIAPPPPPADLPPPLPMNDHPPGVAASPGWRTHFAPSPSPSAFGVRGTQSERDRSPVRSSEFGGDAPWTNGLSSPSAPRKPSRWDKK